MSVPRRTPDLLADVARVRHEAGRAIEESRRVLAARAALIAEGRRLRAESRAAPAAGVDGGEES